MNELNSGKLHATVASLPGEEAIPTVIDEKKELSHWWRKLSILSIHTGGEKL